MNSMEDRLSLDAVFDILADSRRRTVLACLKTHESLALADLAKEVVAREQGQPITEVDAEEAKNVGVTLWHCHIQKLVEHDVVEYCSDREIVSPGSNFARVTQVASGNLSEMTELAEAQ